MAEAKISVLQRVVFRDLVEKELPKEAWDHVADCEFFQLGQTFTVRPDSEMPAGFCPTAWHDLRGKIAACLRDEDPLTPLIVCCMDGLRPVTFRIERQEELAMPKVKITVLKTTFHQDLVDEHIQDEAFKKQFGTCFVFEEGQTFISEGWPSMPDGFCERAWPDIRHEVAMVMYGASIPWIEKPGFTITCCNDGLRPVIFKIERIDDEGTQG